MSNQITLLSKDNQLCVAMRFSALGQLNTWTVSTVIVCLLSLSMAQAQANKIYVYTDPSGKSGATDRRADIPPGSKITIKTYGDDGAEPTQKSSSANKSSSKVPSPANFPRIDSGTQQKRDGVRRSILEEELTSERKNLDEARRRLGIGEKPLAGENAASPAYQARVKQLRDVMQNHERNIAAIQKELGGKK